MKRENLRSNYEYHSGKASDVARQLAFAGIAVIWLFRVGAPADPQLPAQLIAPLFFFGLALGLDLLHYVVAAIIWSVFNRYKESQRSYASEDKSFDAPVWINVPALLLFWLKIITVVSAHVLLVASIAKQWSLFR